LFDVEIVHTLVLALAVDETRMTNVDEEKDKKEEEREE
jgi:hypothetical protein